MYDCLRVRMGLGILALLSAGPAVRPSARLAAQIDYRNIDDDRPTLVEDAYPVERYALELLLFPVRVEREKSGSYVYSVVPEVAYGAWPNVQLGLKAPVTYVVQGGTGTWGLSGLKLFALYNLTTETRLPALSMRADLTLPVGGLASDRARVTVKGIATRTLGRSRVHLNGAYSFGSDGRPAAAENPDRWWVGLALDRTLPFRSMLLLAEVVALRPSGAEPVEVNVSAGLRYQVSPTVVFDAGVGRGVRWGAGPAWFVTFGFSRAMGLAGLIPIKSSAARRRS